MEAVQYSKKEDYLEFVQHPKPEINYRNDVLVKVLFCGVAARDILIIDGELPCREDEAFIMGHEISGMVQGVGTDVLTVIPGDNVAVSPYSYCEICDFCRSGTPHLCQQCRIKKTLGVYKNGGWAEYLVVPEIQVFRLSDNFPVELGVFVPVMSTITYSLDLMGSLTVDKKILILGAGLTGLLWIVVLHHRGFRNVVVCEPNLFRHEIVQQMSNNYYVDFEIISPNAVTKRARNDSNFFFDIILDCCNCPKALQQAVDLLNSGGKIIVFGNKPIKTKISISPFELQRKEASIVGITMGTFTFPKSIVLLEYLSDRYLTYDRLGIKVYPLKNYKEALDHTRKGSVLKAVFRMPDDCRCRKL